MNYKRLLRNGRISGKIGAGGNLNGSIIFLLKVGYRKVGYRRVSWVTPCALKITEVPDMTGWITPGGTFPVPDLKLAIFTITA